MGIGGRAAAGIHSTSMSSTKWMERRMERNQLLRSTQPGSNDKGISTRRQGRRYAKKATKGSQLPADGTSGNVHPDRKQHELRAGYQRLAKWNGHGFHTPRDTGSATYPNQPGNSIYSQCRVKCGGRVHIPQSDPRQVRPCRIG